MNCTGRMLKLQPHWGKLADVSIVVLFIGNYKYHISWTIFSTNFLLPCLIHTNMFPALQVELISCIRDTGSKDCHNVSSILFKSLLFYVRGCILNQWMWNWFPFLDLRGIKDKSVFVVRTLYMGRLRRETSSMGCKIKKKNPLYR